MRQAVPGPQAAAVQAAGQADLPWQDRFALLRDHVLDAVPVLLVLDNFEDNLTPGNDGTVNDPSDTDTGWSVELAVAWADLESYNEGRATPPKPGDEWRMNLMRCEWPHEVVDGAYVKGEQIEFWVWATQGIEDMHRPDRWGVLRF